MRSRCRPDGVQRGLVAEIIARFARKGFTLRALKMQNVSKEHAEKHYADLSSKPFFGGLVSYMCSGPVVCMVWCVAALASSGGGTLLSHDVTPKRSAYMYAKEAARHQLPCLRSLD